MACIAIFIIGAGWGMIIHDLAIIETHVHKGDELDLTVNDYLTAERPYYDRH